MNSIRRLAPTATSNFPDRGGESPWRSVFWLLEVATFVTADTVDNPAARPAALSLFEAVYGRVDSVAGWSRGEALRLVGTLFILVELERAFFRGLHHLSGAVEGGPGAIPPPADADTQEVRSLLCLACPLPGHLRDDGLLPPLPELLAYQDAELLLAYLQPCGVRQIPLPGCIEVR